jgi:transposase
VTIPKDEEAEIRRLFIAEKWRVGTIARQLHRHPATVRRVLAQSGFIEAAGTQRPRMIEPYLPLIRETLERYPTLPASRLHEMVRGRGYPGGPDHFRHLVSHHRPRPAAEAYLRLRTLPAEQAQVDWGHFGRLSIGRARRPLMAFVMVLSWSRKIFLRFFLSQRLEDFLRGHEAAFGAWGGVARTLLYDNLKTAVLERRGQAIRFHPTFLEFAGHYCFQPRPVAVGRGLEDLNTQAEQWCEGLAADRPCPEDNRLSVREAFEQERPKLLPLPENPYPTHERVEVQVGKTHLQALTEAKRQARRHRGLDRLGHAVPASQDLLAEIAQRGGNLGSATVALLRLLDQYGTHELTIAVKEALEKGSPHPHTVRLVLERRCHQRAAVPPVPVRLPDDQRVRQLAVRPHDLATYDTLKEDNDHDPNDDQDKP